MEKELEQQKSNFPTFTPLEELEKEQEIAAETASDAVDNSKAEENKKLEEEKEPENKNPFAPLDTSTTEASSDESSEITKDEAIDNFNKAVAMGIFTVPEGFEYDGSEEKTEEVYNYTMKVQSETAKAELFSKISDPYLQHLVNYGMEAGEFANLKEFGKGLKEHLDISRIDLTDVGQATEIVKKHLSDLGNSSKIIDRVIRDAIENDELEEFGLDAKNYFTKKTEDKIAQAQENDVASAKQHKLAEQQYEQNFLGTLKSKELKAEDRAEILNSFNNVELQNGSKIPEYQYKLEQIKQNPSDFIELLQILGKYESGKGFNLETSTKKATEKIKSIYETLNGKSSTIIKSTGTSSTDKSKYVPNFVDTSTII
mgnify:CR=1 FL=1